MGMVFCRGCGKEIHESAPTCPHCGAPQHKTNSGHSINNEKLMLLAESKKKSGWIAAIWNLFLPGAGYMYCGRVILGIIVLLFSIGVAVVSAGLGLIILMPIFFVDGFFCARRYNQKMMTELIAKSG